MKNTRGRSTPSLLRQARLESLLTLVLLITALDTLYLTWRFVALYAGWVEPGTGLCSWTEGIDCDKVLRTPQARAFHVPNAVLGLGFYTAALGWWLLGRRLGPAYRRHVLGMLIVALGTATLFTFRFWWLLVHLDTLCPFCPWNHVLTYVAVGLALRSWALTPRVESPPMRPLWLLGAACGGWFWLCQAAWFAAEASGMLREIP